MVAGVRLRRRPGLDGADAAKSAWLLQLKEALENNSQSAFRLEPLEVGEDRGGVTGALLEIRRGGREAGMEAKFRRKGRM